jgi:AraC-like DNA-binding protein
MFYLPRTALDALADEAGRPRISYLRCQPGVGIDDAVVRHLLSSLLPATAKPEEVPASFLDHVALALSAHLARAYGGMHVIQGLPRGGLAPWQMRRAKELMNAKLDDQLPLSRLAEECGLSVRHFARAFRQSTGVPPHRWLLNQRVERAKDLLHDPSLSLADVALACEFADQSHFTRVFTAVVRMSPGLWRRMQSWRSPLGKAGRERLATLEE